MKDKGDLSIKRKAIGDAVLQALQKSKEGRGKPLRIKFKELEVAVETSPMQVLLGISSPVRAGVPVTEFLEVLQGVTWGGKGTEQVFDLSEQDVNNLGLEDSITLKRIGGEDVKRWRIEWTKRYLLFPYITNKDKWSKAFELIAEKITKPITINDSLDLEQTIDDAEKRLLRQGLSEDEKRKKMLEHRIALGLVKYPNAATYLTQYYEQLSGREFENKTLQEYNKMWYEYHRPRTPEILRKPRIVGPRLIKTSKFALDLDGFLPRDSVVVMIPKQGKFEKLRSSLEKALGRKCSEKETLLYILAFLNSEEFNRLLREKISKKRGGYPIVDERLLQKLGIPLPAQITKGTVEELLKLVKKAVYQGSIKVIEEKINTLVMELFKKEEEQAKPNAPLENFIHK